MDKSLIQGVLKLNKKKIYDICTMLFLTVLFLIASVGNMCSSLVTYICYMYTISLCIHIKNDFLKEHNNILEDIVKYLKQGPKQNLPQANKNMHSCVYIFFFIGLAYQKLKAVLAYTRIQGTRRQRWEGYFSHLQVNSLSSQILN